MKKVYWNYWFGDDHEAKLPDEFMITPKKFRAGYDPEYDHSKCPAWKEYTENMWVVKQRLGHHELTRRQVLKHRILAHAVSNLNSIPCPNPMIFRIWPSSVFASSTLCCGYGGFKQDYRELLC